MSRNKILISQGGFGGICAVLVGKVIILPRIVRLIPGHPFDLVKVRLQTAQTGVYSGMMDCVRKTIARDGARVRESKTKSEL